MKTLLYTFLFSATLCYSQSKNVTLCSYPSKIVNMPNWKLEILQTDSNRISVNHDLFKLSLSKHNDTLNSVELRLYDGKLTYVENPSMKNFGPNDPVPQVGAWPITKTTVYYDLNGDTEFDFIVKLGHNRKPGDLGDNEEKAYIIFDNKIIQLRVPKHSMGVDPHEDATDLDGHIYRMTSKGWVMLK